MKVYTYKKTAQGELRMIVHRPAGWSQADRRPAIVFFGGGGWQNQTTNQFLPQAIYLAERGMVTARAEYRTKKHHGVGPDICVADAKSAVRWMRVHAAELGIDPDRIVSAGGSAGAHLAISSAVLEGFDEPGEDASVSCRPNALVLFNPPLNFLGDDQGMMAQFVNGDKELARRLSPTLFIQADSPPMLLMYGSEDNFVKHAQELIERGKGLGYSRAELMVAQGQKHGFFNTSPWLEQSLRRTDEFLASLGYLQGKPTIQDNRFQDRESLMRKMGGTGDGTEIDMKSRPPAKSE